MTEHATPVEPALPDSPKPPASKAPASSGPRTWQVGDILADRYRLIERLGEGAMGAVWAGEHVHMRKKFALKILHPEAVSSKELVARFEREAVAAGNIAHPGVAAATDFGQLPDGSFFLVLEYVGGKDLRHLIHQGPLPVARALDITKQILAALGAAHGKGVVHRDIKPENVMLLSRDDRDASTSTALGPKRDVVKILDFGIAKVDANSFGGSDKGADGQVLTRMGSIYGTPNYMAPEQALGSEVDGRADLYAAGVMLYEMIAGTPPFEGDPIIVIAKHVNEAPPPLRSPLGDAALTTEVRALVDGLLAKERDGRPADAAAAIALLDAAAASLPDDRQATMLGDPLAASPKPPWAREKSALDRAHDALRPYAVKLGVKVEHLFYAVAGAAAMLVLILVWLVARPSKPTTVDVDEGAKKKGTTAQTATTTPTPAATTAAAQPQPTATQTATAQPTTTGTATAQKPAGGNSSIKKGGGGGNSFVNKLKSVFH
jgi:serine/threonine-protein kinase